MKCIECGEFMRVEPIEKYENFYYFPVVCSNCGRKELEGPRPDNSL